MLPLDECVGCAACRAVCPKKCITMEPDEKGFLHPFIKMENCIACHACENICQVYHPESKILPKLVLAARVKNTEILKGSSSGGIAYLLSKVVLDQGGCVYGAAFDEHLKVKHIRVDSLHNLEKLQGSKYIQSDIQNVYDSIRDDLKSKTVLFIGTPCQVAAVKKFFYGRENLITCDLICHSAPSPKVFSDHIRAIESNKKKVAKFNFRDKALGWHYNLNRIIYKDGREELHSYWNQCYKRLFLMNLIERESCYSCPYTSCSRVGDITLGDYWNIKNVTSLFDDDKGVNSVFFNTDKAIDFFGIHVKKKTVWMKTKLEDALQIHLVMPCEKKPEVDQFWAYYKKNGYKKAAYKFAGGYHKLTIRNYIKDTLEKYGLLKVILNRG